LSPGGSSKKEECYITHITAVWTLPSVYTLMYLQITSILEPFITHITAMCTFHSAYPLVLFHGALFTNCSIEVSLIYFSLYIRKIYIFRNLLLFDAYICLFIYSYETLFFYIYILLNSCIAEITCTIR